MSTSYYYVRSPFTGVRLIEGPVHDTVTIWEVGANCGTLTVNAGNGKLLCRLFADDSRVPMRTHWGGTELGCIVTENVRGLDPSLVLISESGEPLMVMQIRDRAGHGRGSTKPGELFGYPKEQPR